ncbi:MAG: hypothetical protein K0U98_22695 [Deltaproteobacteria bacterium]|nr:hypothetical protein [Deltaproteobacteria bacterium]
MICSLEISASRPATAAAFLASILFSLGLVLASPSSAQRPHPVLFVTQMPIPADFITIGSVFGNHRPDMNSVGRGGDLHLLYPNGTRRNLTQEAGFGMSEFQGADAIAVRDPAVHWDGTKAVFSMVVGAPTEQFQVIDTRWQLYEVTGLSVGQTAVVTLVPNQPTDFNNVSPTYGTDDRILFISDRPRNGAMHLYPQLDEYETAPTNSGLWRLDPGSGELELLDHAPSGDFKPTVDSFGRVIFSRWDHLQRDQQADSDVLNGETYGTFNYSDESEDALLLANRDEVYPEPRPARTDLLEGTNLEGHRFNHFFPWMVNEDGQELETLNHIGRHELHSYFNRAMNDDPNQVEFIADGSGRFNPNPVENFLQIREDPTTAGRYFAIDAPEFQTHSGGQIFTLDSPPGLTPDFAPVNYITHRDTHSVTPEGGTPEPQHSGFYRNPLPLSDGQLLAVHTAETRADDNEGTRANPQSRYDFRLKEMGFDGTYWTAGAGLTPGISKNLSYWDPDVLVSYSGPLWELDPVEVRPRPRPISQGPHLPAPEESIFTAEKVDLESFRQFLKDRDLALIVSRDVTTRDETDRQQPFNLRVAGGGTETTGAGGTVYEIRYLQLFQADQIRGIGGRESPRAGRRPLAQPQHDGLLANPPSPSGPPGSVTVAADGSVAAIVPARRAMTWQLTDSAGTGVVRERYWLTFQPGEIRVCASCHGLNTQDQAGQPEPTNPPEALRQLLQYWQASPPIFFDGFESGDTTRWSVSVGE